MPLIKSSSRAAISENIREMVHAGHPQDQAVAAALRTARDAKRRHRAEGGGLWDRLGSLYGDVGAAMPEASLPKGDIVSQPIEDYRQSLNDYNRSAADMSRSGVEGMRSGDPVKMGLGAMQSVAAPLMPALAPVGAGVDTLVKAAGRVGPGLEHAADVASWAMPGPSEIKAAALLPAAGKVARRAKAAEDVEKVLEAERNLKNEPRASTDPAATAPVEPATAAPAPGLDVSGGAGGGDAGLQEAQAAAARRAGAGKPLEGLPTKAMKIGDDYFVPGPIASVRDVAQQYMADRPKSSYFPEPTSYHPLDEEHSRNIAQAFEDMKHAPNDPATKAAYDAMVRETLAQYQAVKNSGLKIEAIPPDMPDPYAKNPRLAAKDVADNNHLWFFPTDQGFGSDPGSKINMKTHPMMQPSGETLDGRPLLNNDLFRVVHDYFGHLKEGYGFRAAGEDNAWRSHASMYSDLARPAMTTETRGQNSWVNYGPHGDTNRTASAADTTYADQKVGLMPEWTMRDRNSQPPIITHHGSPHSFDRFNLDRVRTGEGANVYGEGVYLAQEPKVAKVYRDTLAKHGIWTRNGESVPWDHVSDSIVSAVHDTGKGSDYAGEMAHNIISGLEAGKTLRGIKRSYEVPPGAEDGWAAALKAAEPYSYDKNKGHLYDVAIDANPEHFLDWDKTMRGQTPYVRERIEDEIRNSVANQKVALQRSIDKISRGEGFYARNDAGTRNAMRDLGDYKRRLESLNHLEESGSSIYRRMGLPAKSQEEGYTKSRLNLLDKGIPGVKYLDAGSRGVKTAGTRNFVVFNDKLLRILRKYGIAGVPAAGAAVGSGVDRDQRASGGRAMAVARHVRRKRRADGGPTADDMISAARDQLAAQGNEPGGADVVDPDEAGWSKAFSRAPLRERGAISMLGSLATLPKRTIEATRRSEETGEYDPRPFLETATLPLGTGALSGVPLRAGEKVLGSGIIRPTTPPATFRAPDEVGSAPMEVARQAKQKRYAEPTYNSAGNRIINAGVENPPDPSVQTVADPHRMMFPGVYRNPRIIAEEAAARVGPEDPAMKQLFGVTRGDLREMAQDRVGNEEPNLRLAANPRGSLSAQNIQTPQNTQRLIDILHEAGQHEGLRTADAWYIMDPVYRRMVELHGPEAPERYRMFNTATAMASPGSDVMTEIQRGTGAHWLNNEGRFGDFRRFAGVPEEFRSRTPDFPPDMRYIGGHPYHQTAQAGPMQKFFDTGSIQSDAPKVPLYAHASGVPETGFQTTGPVGDAHFSRGVGLSDTRKGPTDVQGSFSRGEYQTLQPWWQHDVAGNVGLESVPAQARLWTALGPQTGVDSELGAPKLELLAKQIMVAAKRLRVSPETARDLILSGKAGAGVLGGAIAAPVVADSMRQRADGGSVNAAMDVARQLRRAKGGKVHVGPIVGNTGGRADEVPMEVPDGSYVLTADHCSAMGQGNTLAGFKRLKEIFPKSVAAYKEAKARGPVKRAAGGRVPIYAADGEFVICPEDIKDRFGDLDHGHKVLDEWQTSERKNHIDTLSKLAPPAQD